MGNNGELGGFDGNGSGRFPLIRTRGMALAVFFVFQSLNCIFLLPAIDSAGWSRDAIARLLALLVFPLLYSVIMFRWPFGVGGALGVLSVDDDGVRIGFLRLRWDELDKVGHGLSFCRRCPLVSLAPKRGGKGFLTLKLNPQKLVIPGYAFVYENVLPMARWHRPDLKFPDYIPSASYARRFRAVGGCVAVVACAVAELALMLIALNAISAGEFLTLHVYAVLIVLLAIPASLAFLEPGGGEPVGLAFLRGAVAGMGVAFFLGLYSFYIFSPPVWTLSALAYFSVLMLVFGMAIVLLDAAGIRIAKGIICVCVVVMAVFAHDKYYTPPPPLMDLSLSFEEESPLFIWSTDGRFFADYSSLDKATRRFLIDTGSGAKIAMPSHPYGDTIRWIGPDTVVRAAKTKRGSVGLFIFEIHSRRERMVDEANVLIVSSLNPVSPDGRRLVWWTARKRGGGVEIKVCALSSSPEVRAKRVQVELPIRYRWHRVDWLPGGGLVSRGSLASEKEKGRHKLVLAKFGEGGGNPEISVSTSVANIFYPFPDFERAFAIDLDPVPGGGASKRSIRFIDLRRGKTLARVEGRQLPSWVSGGSAFRAVTLGDGTRVFTRFDLATGREWVLEKIPPTANLLGVSGDGRYALFSIGNVISFAEYQLLDIRDRRWRVVQTSGLTGDYGDMSMLVLGVPRESVWSPRGHIVVLETLGFNLNSRRLRFNTKLFFADPQH